jgi:hypothetical protein
MIMDVILCESTPQRPRSKEHELGETLALDGVHPAFRLGVQIGRLRRQWYARPTGISNNPLKRWTVLAVSITDEVLAG